MQDYREMEVWQKGHALALRVYQATNTFPSMERYGLITQIRRAAVSVPVNIVEGRGRGGDKELARFLQISLGSAFELEYELLLARDLGFLEVAAHDDLAVELARIKRMLFAFIQTLRKPRLKSQPAPRPSTSID